MQSVLIAGPDSIEKLLSDIGAHVAGGGFNVETTYGNILDYPAEKLRKIDALITIKMTVGEAELAAMPNLRAVISPLQGYDWIDVEAATARAIIVANGEAAENYESMAEATIMLMLVCLYNLKEAERLSRDQQPRPQGQMLARMVSGKTIGVVGYGNIARAFIRRLSAWNARILVSTRTVRSDPAVAQFTDLDALLEQSDVIILATSLNAQTINLLSAEKLAKLKPGCVFVNTARGGLVDEAALAREVENGRISAAALDVFQQEPLPADSPLRSLQNVILTEHIVGHTREMFEAIPRIALENLSDVMAVTIPSRAKNSETAERWLARWSVPASTMISGKETVR
ncbi:NAD(P)-dependent oxidoreductase [Kineobactrum salinum]|uniref:Dehydrogenase n=1 Tax=Kineobactrum salinum TaxID=2708301 RepID=A0A6C0U1B3_9GAMM|nr:NAD(P)-dependent oxidoreductase [Kineobactrum salinum]QIB64115.1 hypothetical protein G3T16_00465 [Kineobactrum salinum]